MDKRQCIFNYKQRQVPIPLSNLSYAPIKTREQFLNNYKMHDIACAFAVHQYLRKGFSIYPLGIDLREKEAIIKSELPNYVAEKGEEIFCFDPKSKTHIRDFGKVNERSAISYRQLAKECNITVYLDFVQVKAGRITGETGYCNIETEPIKKEQQWNGNIAWIFEWKKGLARI